MHGYVYLISHKYESIDVFEKFGKEVQAQFNKKLKNIRTDWGGEYTLEIFKTFCENNETKHQLTID